LEELASRQETIFFQQAVLVPNHDRLAELGERQGQPELTAKSIAIRPNVT
jgi:hypothetical protein